MTKPSAGRPRGARILRYAVIVVVIFGILVSFANIRNLKGHYREIDPLYAGLALACAFALYLLEGIFLRETLTLFDRRISAEKAFKYSFIINALGYLISLGGLTPFATQAYVLSHSGVGAKSATHTRMIQVIFFNLFFDLILVAGFVFLVTGKDFRRFNRQLIVSLLCAFLLLLAFLYCLLFLGGLQRAFLTRLFAFLGKIAGFFSKKTRPIDASKAFAYLNDFREGFTRLLGNPPLLLRLAGITAADWIMWVGILYCSFRALRYAVPPGILILGFAVGQIVGISSMIPGGMGTLEGSMALVYSLFGIPFSLALGAAILNRVFLYIIPFFVSLPMHLSLRRER